MESDTRTEQTFSCKLENFDQSRLKEKRHLSADSVIGVFSFRNTSFIRKSFSFFDLRYCQNIMKQEI